MTLARGVSVASLGLLLLGLVAQSSCSSSSTESPASFCASLCPQWDPCVLADAGLPSSCTAETFESTCEAACVKSSDALGTSESAFIACAACTLKVVGEDICDVPNDMTVAQASCPSLCVGNGVGLTANSFYSSFQSAYSPSASACP